jgi:hypothetical protein
METFLNVLKSVVGLSFDLFICLMIFVIRDARQKVKASLLNALRRFSYPREKMLRHFYFYCSFNHLSPGVCLTVSRQNNP